MTFLPSRPIKSLPYTPYVSVATLKRFDYKTGLISQSVKNSPAVIAQEGLRFFIAHKWKCENITVKAEEACDMNLKII